METRGVLRNFSVMDGASDDEMPGACPPTNPSKKSKTENCPWTENLNLTFVNIVFKRKAHLRTDFKQERKFDLVASYLTKMENTAFYCSPLITATNLKSKWTRMAKQFETKAGLLSEGSNLSGLAEPTKVEKLMITMLQGKAAQKAEREDTGWEDAYARECMYQYARHSVDTVRTTNAIEGEQL